MKLDAAELDRLIAEGEGKHLEFKRGLPVDVRIARTLCAFANARGGLLLVGVEDDGSVPGAPRPRETIERLRAIARERLEPELAVEVGEVLVRRARIVWCSVPLSPVRPHAVVDEAGEREIVVRVGATNRRASGATLTSIRAQRAARLDELQRAVLEWVGEQRGAATVKGFARARNVGQQRARRAFTQLELAGRLVGHGPPGRREYALA